MVIAILVFCLWCLSVGVFFNINSVQYAKLYFYVKRFMLYKYIVIIFHEEKLHIRREKRRNVYLSSQ